MNIVLVGDKSWVRCLDATNGDTLWSVQMADRGSIPFVRAIRVRPDQNGDLHVYYTATSAAEAGKLMLDGTVVWQKTTSGELHGFDVDSRGHLWIARSGRSVQELGANGDLVGTYSLGSAAGPGTTTSARDVTIDAGGRIFVATGQNKRVVEFSPDSNTTIANTTDLTTDTECIVAQENGILSGGNGLLLIAKDLASNEQLDTGGTARAISVVPGFIYWHDATASSVIKLKDDDYSEVNTFTCQDTAIQFRIAASFPGVAAGGNQETLRCYSTSGDQVWSKTLTESGPVEWFNDEGEPPTPEEIFRATFADASGRDPYVSALLNAGDAQRMINHAVSLWAGKPGEWKGTPFLCRVPVDYIRYGELHEATVGNVVEVKVNQPGFENGKRLLVLDTDSELRPGPADMICMGWNSDA